MNLTELADLQTLWASEVVIPPDNTGYVPQANDVIFSLDIQYVGERAFVGLDIQHYSGDIMGTYVGDTDVDVPYVPQFFCFREGPPLLKMVNFVRDHFNIIPDVLLTDGHGIAHPRRFGVACWLGVQTDLPVIGCAKQTLLDYQGELGDKRGSWLPVWLDNEMVGKVLRTQAGVKPIFVSAGHQIALSTAAEVILNLAPRYRVCEPLRRADQAARAYAKGKMLSGVTFLKTLS
ncbi:MAG: endonuclease V [Candidatus Parabeggiatoa sp. nov. 3]|nr:MAG: endonuclease V [Gammaproteobacteria bacterium]RKZ54961.1 MAG: endonuclease V [Gammaproteobacteria bacterium]RKZ75811.1 MAG: endonuclease V [Gammaproteobacteria bacterium]HEW97415.1 endonuclease V [Beggiatoa sp.]